jgi:hypothetical protein
VAAIEECMETIEGRMKELFSDSRVHDSAEAMRCLASLRQMQTEHLECLAAVGDPRSDAQK